MFHVRISDGVRSVKRDIPCGKSPHHLQEGQGFPKAVKVFVRLLFDILGRSLPQLIDSIGLLSVSVGT